MDGLYRGIETSLLALSLALVLAVATLSGLPAGPAMAVGVETTLPMISVTADDGDE